MQNIRFGAVTNYEQYTYSRDYLEGTGQTPGGEYAFAAYHNYKTPKDTLSISFKRNRVPHGPAKESVEFQINAQNPDVSPVTMVHSTKDRYGGGEDLPRGFEGPNEREELAQDAREIAIKAKQIHSLFTVA